MRRQIAGQEQRPRSHPFAGHVADDDRPAALVDQEVVQFGGQSVAAEPGERDALIPDSPVGAAGWSQVDDKGVTAPVESVAVEPDTPSRIEARGRELETGSVP